MTDADALSELVRVGLRNPARVVVKVQSKRSMKRISDGKPGKCEVVEERRIPAGLQNFYISCRTSEKLVQLVRVIEHEVSSHKASHFIVYFATCACVDYFYRVLPKLLLPNSKLFSLHGHLLPAARTRALSAFSSSLASSPSPLILLATDVAARGLDLPHVDVVVQFDPPIDPKAFSHRCGRTARAGRSGRAYVFLAGREIEYIDFLAVRKIPTRKHPVIQAGGILPAQGSSEPEPDEPAVASFLSQIRDTVLTDRALNDKAVKGFVSFVRAYSKHEASYIFRIKDLDLIGAAKSFGLLRLPRMPELKDANKTGWENASLDWNAYAYADRAQEAKRRESQCKPEVQKETTNTRAAKRKRNASWSQQEANKEEREKRKLKRGRKRQWLKSQTAANHSATTPVKSQSAEDSRDDEDDWDEFVEEERLAKKVRKGTTTQQVFDAEFGDL
jgi:ATP-dependent RNA helicase DDX55/SPB4